MVRSKIILLPNYINGTYVLSEKRKSLRDYRGNDFAVICSATDSDLREARRSMFQCKDELQKIRLQKAIKLAKKSMEYYFVDKESKDIVSHLTGSPRHYVEESIAELKGWVLRIEDYIKQCFGGKDYGLVPKKQGNRVIAHEKYIPAGPVVGILPKNSEAESIYLILQIILSRNPGIIRTTSSSGSNFSSLEFARAIGKAAKVLKDNDMEIIRKSVNIVNIFDIPREQMIKKLEVDNATYVVFGSNSTLSMIESSLEASGQKKILKRGTGLSISVVFADSNIKKAAEEICISASIDRGNDCISTNIVYLQAKAYQKFKSEVRRLFPKFKSKHPFDKKGIIGHIHKEDVDTIHSRLLQMNKHKSLRGFPATVHLSTVELSEHDHFEEFPGPVIGIRKFREEDELLRLVRRDLAGNGIDKNLVTSVFTKDREKFEHLSETLNSYTFKWNKGSHRMNLFLEHQGMYLIKEFLDKRMLE